MGRKIQDKLFLIIDGRIAKNGSAQLAVKNKDARSLFVYAMEACVGEKESGNNQGTFVELVQRTVDNKASKEPWCMALIQTGLAYVERKLGVKSPIVSTEHCLTAWRETPKTQRVKIQPLSGAIIIWQHGSSEQGHTGVMTEYKGKKMTTVEGNTGQLFREGDGVYEKERSTTKDGSMKVVGFLKPF